MQIIKEYPLIDEILSEYQGSLQADFERYKNHVYRVFNFAVYLAKEEKENLDKLAITLAFHDLGIWTHRTFDYLDPSIEMATKYLIKINKSAWISEISLMIDMHHKVTPYKGDFSNSVELIRMADLVDVSLGAYKFNIPDEFVKAVKSEFSNSGFHSKLFQLGLGNFFKSPFNPLPMFKK